jgi:hypothetical protein
VDRLEQMKGYPDKLTRDDTDWLMKELEVERALARAAEKGMDQLEGRVTKLSAQVLKLKGAVIEPPCPCNSPDDHAGWCPRRG